MKTVTRPTKRIFGGFVLFLVNRGLEDRLFEKEEQKHKSIVIQKSVTETGPAGDQHRNRERLG